MRATIGAGCVVGFFLIMQMAGGLALTGFGWALLIGSAVLAVFADLRTPVSLPVRKPTRTNIYNG